MNRIVKQKINQGLILLIIVVAFTFALSIMLKYKTEGETNMPFTLKKMIIISSAESDAKTGNTENLKWNFNINQYNDIYIEFEKNPNFKNESYIKSITLENFDFSTPNKGQVMVYMPNPGEEKLFDYQDNLKIKDSLTFKGAETSNYKALNIANQGGTILFRAVNKGISEYQSNEDQEIAYDGTLLSKANVSPDDLKFSLTFDVVIETENNKYRGTIAKELPYGDIEKDGVTKETIENFDDVVFKRE